MLSHAFWQKEYGGDPMADRQNLSLEGHNFEIAGVARAGFSGVEVGSPGEVFMPLCTEPVIHAQSMLDQRAAWWLSVAGRRKSGVTEQQATAYLNVLAPPMYAATLPPDDESQKEYLATALARARVHAARHDAPHRVRRLARNADGRGSIGVAHRLRQHSKPATGAPRRGSARWRCVSR